MLNKFEKKLWNELSNIIGWNRTQKIATVVYKIYFWFKYKPSILRLKLNILKLKLEVNIKRRLLE